MGISTPAWKPLMDAAYLDDAAITLARQAGKERAVRQLQAATMHASPR